MFEQMVQNFPGLLQFQCLGNKSVNFTGDTALALVENDYQNENACATIVEYKKGTRVVRKVQEL